MFERLGLPPYGKSTFQDFNASCHWREGRHHARDITLPLLFNFISVRAGQARHLWQEALSIRLLRLVIQRHCELADWARKAARHIFHIVNAPIRETRCYDCCLIDARPAVLAGKVVRTSKQLPIEDMLEPFHRGSPRGAH